MERTRGKSAVSRRSWSCSILLACALLSIAACDPGFRYRPFGWQESDGEWVWRGRSFVIRMTEPGGIISSERMVPEMTVQNLGEAAIVFAACTLTTKGRQHGSSLPARDLRYRTVKPHATLRLPLFFRFEGALFEVLGESFDLDLQYSVGDQGRNLHIHFVKDR